MLQFFVEIDSSVKIHRMSESCYGARSSDYDFHNDTMMGLEAAIPFCVITCLM